MKKIILIAGYPATGKTYMSEMLIEKFKSKRIMYFAQDQVKEMLYDAIGFANNEEKKILVEYAREIFYKIAMMSVSKNEYLILDYPFSHKQKEFLNSLKEDYELDFLTIRLVGNLKTLYERRKKRDLQGNRNRGHILEMYYGNETYDETNYPWSFEDYEKNCLKSDYANFKYGQLIEVDVTNYGEIDYELIISKVENFLN